MWITLLNINRLKNFFRLPYRTTGNIDNLMNSQLISFDELRFDEKQEIIDLNADF